MATCLGCRRKLGVFESWVTLSDQSSIVCQKCFSIISDYCDQIDKTDLKNVNNILDSAISAINEAPISDEGKKALVNHVESFYNNRISAEGKQAREEGLFESWERQSRYSTASGRNLPYVVLQVTLKEKFFGTGSGNLTDLEEVINAQVAKGYRLHTMSTSNGGSKGLAGGDRIQATLVFERLDIYQAAFGTKHIGETN